MNRSIPSAPREQILTLADDLIRKKGYNAFSYKNISTAMAIQNAAVHYYFPTKEALGASVVGAEIHSFDSSKAQWQALSPKGQLKALFGLFGGYSRQGKVCLMGSMSPDYETLPESIQANLQILSREILDWLTGVLQTGRAQQQFRFEGEPSDRALLVISGLISSLLLARVHGPEMAGRIHAQLLRDVLVNENDA